jgi:hypothetical protein
MRIICWMPTATDTDTHTHTHTHKICNTCCFSTATMVARTRLSFAGSVSMLTPQSVLYSINLNVNCLRKPCRKTVDRRSAVQISFLKTTCSVAITFSNRFMCFNLGCCPRITSSLTLFSQVYLNYTYTATKKKVTSLGKSRVCQLC